MAFPLGWVSERGTRKKPPHAIELRTLLMQVLEGGGAEDDEEADDKRGTGLAGTHGGESIRTDFHSPTPNVFLSCTVRITRRRRNRSPGR